MMRSGACSVLPMSALPIVEIDYGSMPTLPPPTASSYGSNQSLSAGATVQHSLETMARKTFWPTPTVNGNYNRKGLTPTSGDGLATAVARYSTPMARDYKDNASPSEHQRNTPSLASHAGGALNPMWVEWLMGWPTGATELRRSATVNAHNQWWLRFSRCALPLSTRSCNP